MQVRKRTGRWWKLTLAGAVVTAILGVGIISNDKILSGQETTPSNAEAAPSSIYTPAHRSFGEAVRHFLGIRPDPVQPISILTKHALCRMRPSPAHRTPCIVLHRSTHETGDPLCDVGLQGLLLAGWSTSVVVQTCFTVSDNFIGERINTIFNV